MGLTENTVCEKCGWPLDRGNKAHQLPVGFLLRDQYIIGRVLGQGGFGITYLGWDKDLEMPVAIKEFYPNTMVTRDCNVNTMVNCISEQALPYYIASKERFLREAKALAKLRDVPEVVDVYNFFEDNGTAYITMEYIRGTDLATYVNRRGGRLEPEEAFRILRPVMEALDKVHQAELVHRDISPDNIMLHPKGGAKLLDFGAVRDIEGTEAGQDMAHSTEAILKHGFAPAEQYNSRGSLGPWTDEYAMCATVYYCVTGRIPPQAVERMLENTEVDFNIPGLPWYQQAALRKGMAIRATDRHGSMKALVEALFPAEEPVADLRRSEEPAAVLVEAPDANRPRKRSKGVRAFLTILAALLILAAATFILFPRGWTKQGGRYVYYQHGKKVTSNWLHEGEGWYYFDKAGAMVTGWYNIWDAQYYFLETGTMATGLQTIDGNSYYFGDDGILCNGWQKIDDYTYYFGEDGIMCTGWQTVNGSTYSFGEDGIMRTFWQTIDGSRFFFDADGAMRTGWQTINGDPYHFSDGGAMSTLWQTIDGKIYYFGADGIMHTGKCQIDGKMYWFSDTGAAHIGFYTHADGLKYYFDENGVMRTGWQTIRNKAYYFEYNGNMLAGWQTIDGNKYYFGKDGAKRTGWHTIDGSKYYFGNDGVMRTGRQTIKGINYYFGDDGKLR